MNLFKKRKNQAAEMQKRAADPFGTPTNLEAMMPELKKLREEAMKARAERLAKQENEKK